LREPAATHHPDCMNLGLYKLGLTVNEMPRGIFLGISLLLKNCLLWRKATPPLYSTSFEIYCISWITHAALVYNVVEVGAA